MAERSLALEVDDLHVTFPAAPRPVRALRGASLQVAAGEIVGLVGESGSGKSVLGLAALGLLPRAPAPELSGRIFLDGLEMVTASDEARRARRGVYVGAVFQDPMTSLNPTMRVGRQVAEAGGGIPDDAVVELLERAGIPNAVTRLRQFPHELSGGLRQRVMIAMAIGRGPRIVIADEPTTALDVTVQAGVLRLLAQLRRETGTAVLLVTHDLGVAAAICDRIAVAYAGRIVEAASTATLLADPRHPYTVGLLASRPRLDHRRGRPLASLPGRMPDPRELPFGCAFEPRCPVRAEICGQPPQSRRLADGQVECHRPGELEAWPAVEAPALPLEPRAVAGPAVVVRDLVVEYPVRGHQFRGGRFRGRRAFRAVDGVGLEVPAGGALAIVGESGSGKTTLLRAIVGLAPPTAGSIELPDGERPQLVFQEAGSSLTPWLTVGAHLKERLALAGVPREGRDRRVHEALEAVGLGDESAGALPRQLSGGQRQRAAIARAIVVPPALLACDEPVSALDVSLAAQVINLLGDLRRQLGIALLFVTHDLAVARAIADEIVVMHGGRIVERGAIEDVLDDPRHAHTQELLAAVPTIEHLELVGAGEEVA
jgi:peptide/nickel transport system ATP-binding protein